MAFQLVKAKRGRSTDHDTKAVNLRIDQDVLNFFKEEGPGHTTRMRDVLREYMETQKVA